MLIKEKTKNPKNPKKQPCDDKKNNKHICDFPTEMRSIFHIGP